MDLRRLPRLVPLEIDVRAMQTGVGHHRATMTLDVYTHQLPPLIGSLPRLWESTSRSDSTGHGMTEAHKAPGAINA